ncbi:MCE family protein [Gordonia sp. NPDC058843]|uniref:MCE family protein n=1 Tax=Gordonia sp. NPDC058843 TaxID=3346648 RepID=UPI00368D1C54
MRTGTQGRATMIKVTCYTAVMLLILSALIVVFGNFRSGSTHEYEAVFSDASGLKQGQNVRVAGVPVGKVESVELDANAEVRVAFTVSQERPLDTGNRALVRYENLTGDRYLEITRGDPKPGRALGPGGVIPLARTAPALDIDSLVGGFKPLFQSVRGDDLNRLMNALIGVLQGQGENINTLLASTGSTTTMLADQDAVIGELISSLNVVLATAHARRHQVSDSVEHLQLLVDQFANRGDPMDEIVTRLERATLAAGGLLGAVRSDVRATVVQLDRTAGQLVAGRAMLDSTLAALPDAYRRLARMGAYGAGFQLYACQGVLRLTGTDGKNLDIPLLDQTDGRCAK